MPECMRWIGRRRFTEYIVGISQSVDVCFCMHTPTIYSELRTKCLQDAA
eukprot:COSAG01_NODE_72880_length_251_cov_3.361842_1_plen_48_part_01